MNRYKITKYVSALLISGFIASTTFLNAHHDRRNSNEYDIHLSNDCGSKIEHKIEHDAVYFNLYNALNSSIPLIIVNVRNVTNDATYNLLLAQARSIVAAAPNLRLLIALPDGRVVLDTSKADGTSSIASNSFANFLAGTINENHNTRIAILDAQLYPCGVGVETKYSSTNLNREKYVAIRLGDYLDNMGTARLSVNI